MNVCSSVHVLYVQYMYNVQCKIIIYACINVHVYACTCTLFITQTVCAKCTLYVHVKP